MATPGSPSGPDDRRYHHGHLPPVVLSAAVAALAEVGPTALSLRDVARQAGVSHTAVAHHFGDKAGLFTAVATEGFGLLAEELGRARADGFLEIGVAYVRFAVAHRPYFEVMFRPDLLHSDDPALLTARARTGAMLYGSVGEIGASDAATLTAGVAAWSLVHGIATLWLDGALPAQLGDDPEAITRAVAVHLGGGRSARPTPTQRSSRRAPAAGDEHASARP